jgi:murein L,D-transpeptidase YcbB/YkuD
MDEAVRRFQEEHGLAVDGVVGGATLAEINLSAEDRLGQVVVAMERERWLNIDRGRRHVWVNLADFSAKIVDDGKVTVETRAVVGATPSDRQSPEFSDQMEHLIVNPSWHVPRSIAVKEYLPSFRANPNANGHLTIYYRGQPVARDRINWPVVTAGNWPFELKQAPSRSNALGLVKFMFPNQWDIYLHDTPAKELFNRSARAYSHGCIRLQDPFDFAYALLARQTDDPEGLFKSRLDTGRESRIDLDVPVPVHLVYRTAFTTPRGALRFRPDIYGRDRAILAALEDAGVAITDLPS